MKKTTVKRIVSVAMLLALFVVVLGAYTRLTDAGLGCPDWPGCYGHMVLPSTEHGLTSAQMSYPAIPIEERKAWTEMAHRYVAGSLGLLICFIVFTAFKKRFAGEKDYPIKSAALLLFMLFFQAALGMWTVTMNLLPVVVMGHLLGGLTILSLLTWYRFSLNQPQQTTLARFPGQAGESRLDGPAVNLSKWFVFGVAIVFFQIALGGWVSSNYAGLACIGFPYCNGQLLPTMNFSQGFNLISSVGANHQGGLLDSTARVTIQVVHRVGAVITVCYLIGLAITVLTKISNTRLRKLASLSLMLVFTQFCLGIINVVDLLPLSIAVAHNGVAALLLATMIAMTVTYKQESARAR